MRLLAGRWSGMALGISGFRPWSTGAWRQDTRPHHEIWVHHFMELCWDKCVEKPGSRLDSRTENCLSSCVDRFIDTTLAITGRFAQIVQKGGQ